MRTRPPVISKAKTARGWSKSSSVLWHGRVEDFLSVLPNGIEFDLVVSSPPYNLGKAYEDRQELANYVSWQSDVIRAIVSRMSASASICWQVGNHVLDSRRGGMRTHLLPLDLVFHPIFQELGLKLRNRIVWKFGHGLHCKHRFSGRYEVVLWYTKSNDYTFNLDDVRIEQKYPGKKHYKGPRAGEYSSNPMGKNPEDVWEIPNVKSNHIEKTEHPCQFPVALIERLVLALTNPNDLVFDPFAGVASAGVAAIMQGRRFWGCETVERYIKIGVERLGDAMRGRAKIRPLEMPLYDHRNSKLSVKPNR